MQSRDEMKFLHVLYEDNVQGRAVFSLVATVRLAWGEMKHRMDEWMMHARRHRAHIAASRRGASRFDSPRNKVRRLYGNDRELIKDRFPPGC
jgi:predicted ATPase